MYEATVGNVTYDGTLASLISPAASPVVAGAVLSAVAYGWIGVVFTHMRPLPANVTGCPGNQVSVLCMAYGAAIAVRNSFVGR